MSEESPFIPLMPRHLRNRGRTDELRTLLQNVLAAELTSPSDCLWLVSPWIGDPEILDNRTGLFSSLDPTWPRRFVRMSALLESLLVRGGTLVVATKPGATQPSNVGFLARSERWRRQGMRVRVTEAEDLHEKGLLGNGYYLNGSMNFTTSGVQISQELLVLHTDPATVAANRLALRTRWGGPEVFTATADREGGR
jgi:hypothetical protein